MTNRCFEVTTGSFDGVKISELAEPHIQSKLEKILPKSNFWLYGDDGLPIFRDIHRQYTEKVRKSIIRVSEDLDFSLEIKSSLK